MPLESLAQVVLSLTAQEQEAVLQFIHRLKEREDLSGSPSAMMKAADEFIAEHQDLLHRLAQ